MNKTLKQTAFFSTKEHSKKTSSTKGLPDVRAIILWDSSGGVSNLAFPFEYKLHGKMSESRMSTKASPHISPLYDCQLGNNARSKYNICSMTLSAQLERSSQGESANEGVVPCGLSLPVMIVVEKPARKTVGIRGRPVFSCGSLLAVLTSCRKYRAVLGIVLPSPGLAESDSMDFLQFSSSGTISESQVSSADPRNWEGSWQAPLG